MAKQITFRPGPHLPDKDAIPSRRQLVPAHPPKNACAQRSGSRIRDTGKGLPGESK